MVADRVFARLRARVLDFALPPRCAGCGTIVGDVHSFCADCWTQIEFLGEGGCETCGLPLQATERRSAARCLAGRRGSLGRAPRSFMTSCREASRSASNTAARSRSPGPWRDTWRRSVEERRRARCWCRCRCIAPGCGGADSTSRRWSPASCRGGWTSPADPFAFRRIKRTPPLKGMSPLQRRKAVAGRVQGPRQSGGRREDHHPGRRRADHGKHGRGLRARR